MFYCFWDSGRIPVIGTLKSKKCRIALHFSGSIHRVLWFNQTVSYTLMRPFFIIITDILADKRIELAVAKDDEMIKHSRRNEPTNRSAKEFIFGEKGTVAIPLIPSDS